jgi:hypothetical protein
MIHAIEADVAQGLIESSAGYTVVVQDEKVSIVFATGYVLLIESSDLSKLHYTFNRPKAPKQKP